MNRLLSCICVVAALTLCISIVQPIRAGVIYTQTTPASPIGAFSSTDRPAYQKIADNFFLNTPGAATVRSLRFIGGYVNTSPPPITPPLDALPTDNFRVVFSADSAGAPGIPLVGGDFSIGTAVTRTPTGGPLLNGEDTPFEYIIDLGTGIPISASTIYWISITNNPGSNYGWDWARAVGVYDQRTAGTDGEIATGSWSVVSNGGMWFELRDSNVPEPGSFGVFLAGVFGMYCIRARRRCRNRPVFAR